MYPGIRRRKPALQVFATVTWRPLIETERERENERRRDMETGTMGILSSPIRGCRRKKSGIA